MRQVPMYTIVGNGCMAQHMCHYLNALNISYFQWQRSSNTLFELDNYLKKSTHVLLLISDAQIEYFAKQYLSSYSYLTFVHFSGALVSNIVHGAHPLQSFVKGEKYQLLEYQHIPFIIASEGPTFTELLPGLNNPHYRIHNQDKAYYHAVCVMANNFTTILWQKFFNSMQVKFKIKPEDLMPYLAKTFQNIQQNPNNSLTGPLSRNDIATIESNIHALNHDNFQIIYKAFVEAVSKPEECINEICN